jgi:Predicted O-linked N-acetylglucosamine transferase, SPINDLY family
MTIQNALALHQAGRFAEAEQAYRQLLASDPRHVHALHFYGVLRAQGGDMAGSADLIGRALKINPDDPLAHFHLAEAFRALEKHSEAEIHFARAAALKPDFAEAFAGKAAMLGEMKRWGEALQAAEAALAVKRDFYDAEITRGMALYEIGRLEDALRAFERASSIDPNRAEAFTDRGSVLTRQGKLAEALAAFEAAVLRDPSSSSAHNNRANVLLDLDRPDEALVAFQQALAAEPSSAVIYYNFGSTLLKLRQWQAALAAFDSALALKPDYAEAIYNRSGALYELGRREECAAAQSAALAINPNLGLPASRRFFDKAVLCDWQGRALETADLMRFCAEERLVDNLAILAAFDDPVLHLKAARAAAGPRQDRLHGPARPSAAKLKIGYLSADFREHPVGLQLVEVLERHDRSGFEVTGICTQSEGETPFRSRIKAACDHFFEGEMLTDRGLMEAIAGLGLDILIDLGGYTEKSRTKALAAKPAPVIAEYLGFAGTTGADYIDYLIADGFAVPPGHDGFFSEKIVRLPGCFFPADTIDRPSGLTRTRTGENLPENAFVFCSFNNSYKITPELFDIWMRLLHATPGSVLWLRAEKPVTRANLKREAKARGIGENRLVFAEWASRRDHLGRIGLADLFLDSTPYNAHTTCNDALWAGLPVLTCSGKSFASRAAGSMLMTAGVPELIASDLAAYEALALDLAHSAGRIDALRARITAGRERLFDMAALTRSLEAAYRQMADLAAKGQNPAAFSVTI